MLYGFSYMFASICSYIHKTLSPGEPPVVRAFQEHGADPHITEGLELLLTNIYNIKHNWSASLGLEAGSWVLPRAASTEKAVLRGLKAVFSSSAQADSI